MSKKDIIIKVWPELTNYIPATIPYSSIKSKYNAGRHIILDFTNCNEVNSTGLNILLIQILKLMSDISYQREWHAKLNGNNPIINKIAKLGLFNKLNKYSQNSELFWNNEYNEISTEPFIEKINPCEIMYSYPIMSQELTRNVGVNNREYLSVFRSWFYKNFFELSKKYEINIINLINVLTEIVKNTSDHTGSDSFLGIDVIENINKEYIKIHFSIGDLGPGINVNIKNWIFENNLYIHKLPNSSRKSHWDFTETYMWALTSGNSTKKESKINKGIGMSSIIESSSKVPMELSVFDAFSRGIISNLIIDRYSHSKTRKEFYSIGKPTGFYYYGKIYAKKI